jgi:hypothetical protein
MEKHELELVTSTCTMTCNVLLQDYTRHTHTLPLLRDLCGRREADLRGQSSFTEAVLGLKNARWVSVHEVDVRLRLGNIVPLGRLQEIF